MILINKYTKLGSQMASMYINDRPHIKQSILIGLSIAKFLLYGVYVVHFTCVALAKASLVVGPPHPSVRPSIHLSVHLSATLLD